MQQRKSLVELAQEVERLKEIKKDFVLPSSMLAMDRDANLWFGSQDYEVGKVAHEQISEKLGIPKKYYDRMLLETPNLLASNVNEWLSRSDDKRMVRTLGNSVRAVLSDRYRPLDYDMILEATLPVLFQQGEMQIVSSEITERRMYLQVVSPRLTGEVKKGDIVQMGISISSSDVGLGALNIDPYLLRLICLNGAVLPTAMKKHHIGKRIEADEMGIFSSQTIDMDNKVFLRKLKETVQYSFDELGFQDTLRRISFTADHKIVKEIDKTIQEVTKRFDLSIPESDSVLKNLINGGDLSQWGLANAVTAVANDHSDYDRAIELQRIGGKVIDLSESEWTVLAA